MRCARSIIGAIALAVVSGHGAFATDLMVNALALPASLSWTGFHAGVHDGIGSTLGQRSDLSAHQAIQAYLAPGLGAGRVARTESGSSAATWSASWSIDGEGLIAPTRNAPKAQETYVDPTAPPAAVGLPGYGLYKQETEIWRNVPRIGFDGYWNRGDPYSYRGRR